MYKILTFDGGGIRGLLTATFLDRLIQSRPNFLAGVDLFAGTSTGGIIALGLAAGLSTQDLIKLYRTQGPLIFRHTFLHDAESLGGLRAAKYPTEPRKDALSPIFGSRRLADLPKNVLIPAFDLDSALGPEATTVSPPIWKPKFFHNFVGPDSDGDQSVLDVALRTSAAPVYFPIYQGYIDGGVIANNPSMCAVAQALHPNGAGKVLDEVVLLSLGTGGSTDVIASLDGDWGLIQWNTNLVSIPLGGAEGVADYQCGQILRERYMRVQPMLQPPVGLDDIDKMDLLQSVANSISLGPILAFIDQYWK